MAVDLLSHGRLFKSAVRCWKLALHNDGRRDARRSCQQQRRHVLGFRMHWTTTQHVADRSVILQESRDIKHFSFAAWTAAPGLLPRQLACIAVCGGKREPPLRQWLSEMQVR